MSRTGDYALRPRWSTAASDLGAGLYAVTRLVVTSAGCLALLAAAVVVSDRDLRRSVAEILVSSLPTITAAEAAVDAVVELAPEAVTVAHVAQPDPREQHVAQYLARRYRVADEAVRVLVAAAFEVGREKKLDPLLILSVMAIESSFNPFAQSPVGAQGLMQVMTRVHTERFEPHGGEAAALDPIVNIKVGSSILRELIARGGSVERGLQLYVGAGNLPDDGGYGARVLGERSRLELRAATWSPSSPTAPRCSAWATSARSRAKPVMEGKGVLFKKFAGIDVFDIEVDERDPDKLVDIIAALEPTFGGINLEDIKAPECFYVERKLRERMKIPVFHDDQHGTAIVVGAAVLNG
jgi:hypothetical protein